MTAAPLRIGMLGASRIAELAIIDASRQTGDTLAAVAARDPERARAYAAEHGFARAADSYADLLADDSLDLIYIGLPNALHAEWTAQALKAGRSVLVEKPFAANLPEFDRVAARLEAAEGWAWEAFHYADHPLLSRVLAIARSGELGERRELRLQMLMPDPGANDPRWNFDLAGGAVMDLGCYSIHAMLTIADELGATPVLREARATGSAADNRVDATLDAELELVSAEAASTPIAVTLRTSMVHDGWDFGLELVGTAGSILAPNFVKPQEDDRLIVRVGDATREEHVGTGSSYVYQLERIRAELRDGVRDRGRLDRSRRTMALIDELYEASGLPLRPGRLGCLG
mgnify:FL=1